MRKLRKALAVLFMLTLALTCAGCGKKKGEASEVLSTPTVGGPAENVTEAPDISLTDLEPSKGLVYAPSGETLTIVGIGSCEDRHLVIPAEIDGKKVVSIAENAFAQNLNIERVTIPAGVTLIDKKAFRGCRNLRKVDWPSDLERIGERSVKFSFNGTDDQQADIVDLVYSHKLRLLCMNESGADIESLYMKLTDEAEVNVK